MKVMGARTIHLLVTTCANTNGTYRTSLTLHFFSVLTAQDPKPRKEVFFKRSKQKQDAERLANHCFCAAARQKTPEMMLQRPGGCSKS